jgi:GR25 family glycosyltransferase involved in LPS biosynthesis
MPDSIPKYTLAVGAIFKNEGHCLKEWIEHYIFHGAQHFYLINDQSTDNFAEILQPYIDKGYVTLNSPIWDRYMGRQHDMYNTLILPNLKMTEWLLMVDLDEFMWSPTSQDLHWVLSRIPNVGQIQVEHTLFGSNGHKEQPKSLVKGFIRRSVDSPSQNPGLRKYFIKSTYAFSSLNLHHATFVNKEDENNHFIVLNDPYFVLNHYNCQSETFWKNVKCTRGDADEYKVRDMELFKLNDQNDVEDKRLVDQNASMIPCVPDEPSVDFHVFILSVKENLSRRANVEAMATTFRAMGVEVEIFDAFYWKTTDVMKLMAEYGVTYSAPNNYVSLSQVGCFLSHYAIWRRLATFDGTKHYIILEDDMKCAPDFTLADLSSALPKDYDMVYLWKHPAKLEHYEAHHVPGQAYATFYPQWGTTAYMITPSIAQTLLKQIKTLYAPIDDMLIKDVWGNLKTFIMKKDYFTTGTFPSMIFGEV